MVPLEKSFYSVLPVFIERGTIQARVLVRFAKKYKDARPSEKEKAKEILHECHSRMDAERVDYVKALAEAFVLFEDDGGIRKIIENLIEHERYRSAAELFERLGDIGMAKEYYFYGGDVDNVLRLNRGTSGG